MYILSTQTELTFTTYLQYKQDVDAKIDTAQKHLIGSSNVLDFHNDNFTV